MKLLEIVERALNASRESLEDEETVVLKFIHGFAEHPLAGLAGAVLFDRESEGLARGEIPPGFVRQRDFERAMKPLIRREEKKRKLEQYWRDKKKGLVVRNNTKRPKLHKTRS